MAQYAPQACSVSKILALPLHPSRKSMKRQPTRLKLPMLLRVSMVTAASAVEGVQAEDKDAIVVPEEPDEVYSMHLCLRR